LAHGFRGFSLWSLASVASGLIVRKKMMAGACIEQSGLLQKEKEGERGERERRGWERRVQG
jgi:hypothetical protein